MNPSNDLPLLLPFAQALYESGGPVDEGDARRVRLEAEREIVAILTKKARRKAS